MVLRLVARQQPAAPLEGLLEGLAEGLAVVVAPRVA